MIANKDTLKLAYSTKCTGIIWKIILDEKADIIVWECRTLDKKVSFYAYDFKNQCTLLSDFKFDADWQLSINKVANGILYLNGYESEFSPVQKGIIAFDLKAKEIIWQNFSIGAQLFTENGIVVFDSKILPRQYRLISYQKGEDLKPLEPRDLIKQKQLGNDIFVPTITEAPDLVNTSFTLTYKDLKITSFYKPQKNLFNQHLSVEKNGRILIDEIINEQIQKISFDTFFVWHSRLFYIRNKSEIVSYFV